MFVFYYVVYLLEILAIPFSFPPNMILKLHLSRVKDYLARGYENFRHLKYQLTGNLNSEDRQGITLTARRQGRANLKVYRYVQSMGDIHMNVYEQRFVNGVPAGPPVLKEVRTIKTKRYLPEKTEQELIDELKSVGGNMPRVGEGILANNDIESCLAS